MISKEQKENIEDNVEIFGDMMSAFGGFNLLLSFSLGYSLQSLWGLIRSMQMMIFIPCQMVTISPFARVFFNEASIIASVDVFD